MKKLIYILTLVYFTILGSSGAMAYTERRTATLRVMDKAAGKTQTLVASVGTPIEFEKISILVRSCRQTDPFKAENFYAFTEITKSDGEIIFSNWMDRNNPGNNPVQNPDYDVWVVGCE
ncbi:MAG: DUF2155 domain-containing protein [Alphaproteobacteria bacterium]|nr:DUF2155 domain-containing protein [Alphaproteobacteria bacterium]